MKSPQFKSKKSKLTKAITFFLIAIVVLIILAMFAKVLFFIGLLVLLGIAIAWAWKEYKGKPSVIEEETTNFMKSLSSHSFAM